MKTLNAKLEDYLLVYGWELAQRHTQDLEWWADEIWELRSRWSPEGTQAFLTFLVDPMWDGHRRKGQGVWAAGCCASFPQNREDAGRNQILRLKGSREEIEEFVEAVNSIRPLSA